MPEGNQVKWVGIRPTDPEENIPIKAGLKTDIAKSNSVSNGVANIHIVTTGKTLNLTAARFFVRNTSGATGTARMEVRNASGVVQYDLFALDCQTGVDVASSLSIFPPLEISADWDIQVRSGQANVGVFGFMCGYEV